ncbi:MAG: hypothetical protein GTN78_19820 [Gemmatimonadales bacterium]|nr:hypothetical protein [Gemmatimonadales bacterium]NIN12622.1 hypothetical protein [Gemmatimonadales bacterium]NIR02415.1 hypothetical protein [Gemmatimonadales bacterium]NIS66206.1 hypothetical protein [Gemmatimonadales bacterium]
MPANTLPMVSPRLYAGSVVVAAYFLVAPASLIAQAPDLVPSGARVRVVATGFFRTPAVATVAGWRADSLLLDIQGRARSAVPVASITRLELSRGRKSKVVTGGAVGLLVGTAATAAFLGMFCSDPDTLCESDEVVRAFAIIAPLPTVVGALIGLAVRVERWESVPVAGLAGGSVGIQGLSVGFARRF